MPPLVGYGPFVRRKAVLSCWSSDDRISLESRCEWAAYVLAIALKVHTAGGPQPPEGSPIIGPNWNPCAAQSSAVLRYALLYLPQASAAAPATVIVSGGASIRCAEVIATSRVAAQLGMNTSAGRLRFASGWPGLGWRSPNFPNSGFDPAPAANCGAVVPVCAVAPTCSRGSVPPRTVEDTVARWAPGVCWVDVSGSQ